MAAPTRTVLPILQTTGGRLQLSDRLNHLLGEADLKRLRVAVSYVRCSGLGLLALQLEKFLQDGGEPQTIYGVANGITSPDSLAERTAPGLRALEACADIFKSVECTNYFAACGYDTT